MDIKWDDFFDGKLAFRVSRACFKVFADECNKRCIFLRGGGVRVSDINPFRTAAYNNKSLEYVLYCCVLPGYTAEHCKVVPWKGEDEDKALKKYFDDIPIITLKFNESGNLEGEYYKMKCKDCKHFNNKIPVSTEKGNDKYRNTEEYIGFCEKIKRPVMMNDDYNCEEE